MRTVARALDLLDSETRLSIEHLVRDSITETTPSSTPSAWIQRRQSSSNRRTPGAVAAPKEPLISQI
jgi:hypothetical protein